LSQPPVGRPTLTKLCLELLVYSWSLSVLDVTLLSPNASCVVVQLATSTSVLLGSRVELDQTLPRRGAVTTVSVAQAHSFSWVSGGGFLGFVPWALLPGFPRP
jgi:hypothetical protein